MEHQSGLTAAATHPGAQDEAVSERVISAVSEATGVDALELEPLYGVVDPDALNAIFSPANGRRSADAELRFTMAGCDVLVHGDGNVVVTPPADSDDDRTAVRKTE